MRLIDRLNLNHLRVFECTYRAKSMTAAADELHLTQSGISQHIKTLEETLGVALFDRIHRRLVPTQIAHTLYARCARSLDELELALGEIASRSGEPAGEVVLGMPLEFGKNLVLPLLLEIARTHPRIAFKLRIGLAEAMNDLLLRGEVDFAFVDDFPMDRRIGLESVYEETLEMAIAEDLVGDVSAAAQDPRKYFESLSYIAYLEAEPILRMWFDHHYQMPNLRMTIRAHAVDAEVVGQFVVGGLGAGILPAHLVERLRQAGHKLHVFAGSGRPLTNRMSVAVVPGRTHSRAAIALLDHLRAGLARRAR